MLILFSLIFAVLGYLLALHLPLLGQIVLYSIACTWILNSQEFKRAELGQIVYLLAIAVFLLGTALGNLVYLSAHWNDPQFGLMMSSVVRAFTP